MRVILHTGAAKTGTSVIQAALAQCRPALAEAGICYPAGFGSTDARAARGKVSSGNAVALGWLLNVEARRDGYDEAAVLAWLDACIAEAAGRDLLFSSEFMQMPAPRGAAWLCRRFAEAGYAVSVIHYVRHALDQAIAVYLQALKRGALGRMGLRDLDSYIRDTAACNYVASLAPFADILPAERIIVPRYEAERDALVARFMARLTSRAIAVPDAGRVMNRSPNAAEQIVFATLSTLPDAARVCLQVADLLLDRAAAAPVVHTVSPAALAGFAARNQKVVDAVNARFPAAHMLLLKADDIRIGPPDTPAPADVYAVFAESVALLASRRGAAGRGHGA